MLFPRYSVITHVKKLLQYDQKWQEMLHILPLYEYVYLRIFNRRQNWYQLPTETEDDNNKLLWKKYLRRRYCNKLNMLAFM
jgi:hypothetical protein